MKTKFASHTLKSGIPEGCKYCVRGEKLVLFVGGKCSRSCYYCSLSNSRKKCGTIEANERTCFNVGEMIEEVKESNAKGAGITGGDPLVYFDRTLKLARALKKKFGKSFHIHIYLPTNLVDKKKLKKLSKWVDEVRFHPSFLNFGSGFENWFEFDLSKILIASAFWSRENIGVEMPVIPSREEDGLDFICRIKDLIGFVNLNELEVSETNIGRFEKENLDLNKDTYSVVGSRDSALRILKFVEREKFDLKVHFCTALTKDRFQFENRLKKHDILPFGRRLKDGNVLYFAVYEKSNYSVKDLFNDLVSDFGRKKFYLDKKKRRIILSEKILDNVLQTDLRVARVVEYPTFDGFECEFWEA